MADFNSKYLLNNTKKLKRILTRIKTIYTDVDGTLVGQSGSLFHDNQGKYTSAIAEAIFKMLSLQIDIVPVSGRNRIQMKNDSRLLGFKNYISELGCQIVYNLGEKIIINVGDFEITSKTVFQTIAESGAPLLLFNNFPNYLEYHLPWSEGRECTHLLRGNVNLKKANQLLQEKGFKQLKLIDNGIINRKSNKLDVEEMHAYHLLPLASGKAEGVEKDMQLRKLKPEETIGLGDSISDLTISSKVGAYFLVSKPSSLDDPLYREIDKRKNIFLTGQTGNLGWVEAVEELLNLDLFAG